MQAIDASRIAEAPANERFLFIVFSCANILQRKGSTYYRLKSIVYYGNIQGDQRPVWIEGVPENRFPAWRKRVPIYRYPAAWGGIIQIFFRRTFMALRSPVGHITSQAPQPLHFAGSTPGKDSYASSFHRILIAS
jgi:hypothetical protein